MSVWAIVVAAGSGARFGGPKQLCLVAGRRVVDRAVDAVRNASDGVVLVVPEGAEWDVAGVVVVSGGLTRSASVRAGLAAVPDDAAVVVVHDAARPGATPFLVAAVVAAVHEGADGAVPGVGLADTIKRIDTDRVVRETVARDELVSVQTPQAFRATVLRAAHASEPEGTDDAAVVEAAGGRVVVVPGETRAMKITELADLDRLAWIIEGDALS